MSIDLRTLLPIIGLIGLMLMMIAILLSAILDAIKEQTDWLKSDYYDDDDPADSWKDK